MTALGPNGCLVYIMQMLLEQKDIKKALSWWRAAADDNDSSSAYLIGKAHYNGDDIDEDLETAVYWFQKAVDMEGAGAELAQFSLGVCQYYGLGCDEDDASAYQNFVTANEEGIFRQRITWAFATFWIRY